MKRLAYIVRKYASEKLVSSTFAHEMLNLRCFLMLQQVLRLYVVPIGICSMSEKQGGQHEIGSKPVQAACNFFTTLTVDGQNRDLVNIWRAVDLDAGDFLTLRLEFCKEKESSKHSYVLNHYYKDTVSRTMTLHPMSSGRIQLIPDVFRLGKQNEKNKHNASVGVVSKHNVFLKLQESSPSCVDLAEQMYEIVNDRRYHPYWHIGQLYNKKQSFTNMRVPTNDMEMTKGQLLQINFAPVWKGTMYKDENFRREVNYCPATALQTLMFGKVEDLQDIFVEAIAKIPTETQVFTSLPATQGRFRGLTSLATESRAINTTVVPVAAAAVSAASEPIVPAAHATVLSKEAKQLIQQQLRHQQLKLRKLLQTILLLYLMKQQLQQSCQKRQAIKQKLTRQPLMTLGTLKQKWRVFSRKSTTLLLLKKSRELAKIRQ